MVEAFMPIQTEVGRAEVVANQVADLPGHSDIEASLAAVEHLTCPITATAG